MPLRVPIEDIFEANYTLKFKLLAAAHGIPIEYPRDRAAIDLGLHLRGGATLTNSRVWFQFKGLHARTLSLAKYTRSSTVDLKKVNVEHLRAWYRDTDPVYLVVYVESVNKFVIANVKNLVDRNWQDELLNPELFSGQKTLTLKVPKVELDEVAWQSVIRDTAMNAGGVSFRGRRLEHPHNPLNSILLPMEPGIFADLVSDLLSEHGYKAEHTLDAMELFPQAERAGYVATLTLGEIPDAFETKLQIGNEFMLEEGKDVLREGRSAHVQGNCAVLIHSNVASCPDTSSVNQLAGALRQRNIRQMLVFVNGNMLVEDMRGYCGHVYIQAVRPPDFSYHALHLEDIAFNLCITTNTYFRLRDSVSWWIGPIANKGRNLIMLPPC